MGRLTEAFAFIGQDPKNFTSLWREHNITSLNTDNEGLIKLRKEKLKEKRASKKLKNID